MKTIAGQRSWSFNSNRVEAHLTETGGHLGPVRFRLGKKAIEPFSIAPWAGEKNASDLPLLQVLRGDFFCMPFGGNGTPYRGERHLPHGETANLRWKFKSLRKEAGRTTLHVSMPTKVRRGRVDKRIQLRDGETTIYSQHIVSGMTGKMSFGHHPMLSFPDEPDSGRISTSRIKFGRVVPEVFEDPAKSGYSSLKIGARFSRIDRVPGMFAKTVDLSRYPSRRGFEDLVTIVHRDATDFAWLAVAFPKQRYVYFALKDPRVLQSTVLWISNGGRHYPPWNGRHVNVMGVEDVTSYFHFGLAESAASNELTRRGIATALDLRAAQPLVVNYIMGLAAIPAGFDSVKAIRRLKDGIELSSPNGRRVTVPVDVSFLQQRENLDQ